MYGKSESGWFDMSTSDSDELETHSSSLRRHFIGICRDSLTVAASLSMLIGVVWWVIKDDLEPYLQMPEYIADVQKQVALLGVRMDEAFVPKAIRIEGNGVVLNPTYSVPTGGYLYVGYMLQRVVSCDTDVLLRFIDADTGHIYEHGTIRSTKAPVSDMAHFFRIPIKVPATLQPGRYLYAPVLTPLECGIYGPQTIPTSGVFTVEEAKSYAPD